MEVLFLSGWFIVYEAAHTCHQCTTTCHREWIIVARISGGLTKKQNRYMSRASRVRLTKSCHFFLEQRAYMSLNFFGLCLEYWIELAVFQNRFSSQTEKINVEPTMIPFIILLLSERIWLLRAVFIRDASVDFSARLTETVFFSTVYLNGIVCSCMC